MPDFGVMFPSRFMKAAQFGGKDVTLTVDGWNGEELEGDQGKKLKLTIRFKERTKKGGTIEMVVNRTNAESIAAMWGREVNGWVGKRITFYPMPYEGDVCIRVRGSPDLEKDLKFDLRLPRKKPRPVILKKTKANGATPEPEAEAGGEDFDNPNNNADPADPKYGPPSEA